MGLARSG